MDETAEEAPKAAEEEKPAAAAGDAPAEAAAEDKKEGDEKKAAAPAAANNQQQRRGQKRKMEDEPFVVVEDEPEVDDALVCLDWHNSDLNLKIDKDTLCAAEPFFKDGWGHVWAGARATHGFTSGKVWYEVKLVEHLDAKVDGMGAAGAEKSPLHEVRVGWSTDDSPLTLGEHAGSVCYSGSAKKGRDCAFEEFGASFAKGDVVGAFVDLDRGDEVVFAWTKNGEKQGEWSVPRADLGMADESVALFPHVSTRNVKVEVNFGRDKAGEDKEPSHAPAAGDDAEASFVGYELAGRFPEEGRMRGFPRVAKREDCEMILLVGLPAAGKTTWAATHREANPDKRYYVIGTSALIERMKVRE